MIYFAEYATVLNHFPSTGVDIHHLKRLALARGLQRVWSTISWLPGRHGTAEGMAENSCSPHGSQAAECKKGGVRDKKTPSKSCPMQPTPSTRPSSKPDFGRHFRPKP